MPEEVLRTLPREAALVDLVRVTRPLRPVPGVTQFDWQDHYEAFILRQTNRGLVVDWVPLGECGPIDQAVVAWSAGLLDAVVKRRPGVPAAAQQAAAAGHRLRQKLWLPVEAKLGECRTVLVIPHGSLTRLPWAALPGKKPGAYLVEEFAVATLPYGQRLADLLDRSRPAGRGVLFLAGGIDYGRTGNDPGVPGPPPVWSLLPETLEETVRIGNLWRPFGAFTRQTGAAADKRAILDGLRNSRFAHLATHGFFADEAPLQRQPVLGELQLSFRAGLPGRCRWRRSPPAIRCCCRGSS